MRVISTAYAVLLLLLAACGEPTSDGPLCDIRNKSCQNRLVKATARLRGNEAFRPRIVVRSASSVIKERSEAAEEERLRFEHWNDGLSLFELSQPSLTLGGARTGYWTRVAGYYSRKSKTITILDRGRPMDSAAAVRLLVHELVHAFQDADDLLTRAAQAQPFGLDGRLARRAVIEGEAKLYDSLAYLGLGGFASLEDLEKFIERWKTRVRTASVEDPFVVHNAGLTFPYAFGVSYMHQAWTAEGNAGVRAVYDALPNTTGEIRHGYPAQAAHAPWQPPLEQLAVPILPQEHDFVASDRLGWWVLDAFCERMGVTVHLCYLLEDDGFSVFKDIDLGGVTAVWRLRMTDAQTAADLAEELLASAFSGLEVEVSERDLILTAASSDEPAVILGWQSRADATGGADHHAVACAAPDCFDDVFCAVPY